MATLVPIDQLRLPNGGTIIPRIREQAFAVSEYAQAMRLYEGWGDFPPIITDQDYLILSGCTRYLAAQRAGIDEIPVDVVECDTPGDRLLVVAAANGTHGNRWDTQSITTLAVLAERFNVGADALASALRVPVSRVERVPIATVVRRGTQPNDKVYVKRAVRTQYQGREITSKQAAVIARLSSPNIATQVLKDLLRLAELDALPPLDPDSHRDLIHVREVLDEWEARDAGALTG